jgi:thiol-disulfide isomerase/thioredoxin
MRYGSSSKSVAWAIGTLLIATSARFATGEYRPKSLVVQEAPRLTVPLGFQDGQGRTRSIADFKGKVVVLNIWASERVPCRREMLALDRLQEKLGGPEFAIVPLSIDHDGVEAVNKFYSEVGILNLPIYIDASGNAVRELGAVGLPTTLILDRAGQEIARVVGPLDWEPSMVAEFLKPSLAAPTGSSPIRDADHGTASQPAEPGALRRGFEWLKALFVR